MARIRGTKNDATEAFDPNLGAEPADPEAPAQPAQPVKKTALNAESQRFNEVQKRKVAKAQRGEQVVFQDDDVLGLFDAIRNQYAPTMITIRATRVGEDPMNCKPMMMSHFKSSSDWYDYMVKTYHRNHAPARYSVLFVEGSFRRGNGFLELGDTTMGAGSDPNASPYPNLIPLTPPQMGGPSPYPQSPYPMPYAPPPPGYGYPQGQGYGFPEQPVMQAPQATQTFEPSAPTAQPAAHPDPNMMIASLYQTVRDMQELVRQNQLQMERTLGETEALRRQIMSGQAPYPNQQGYPVQQAPAPQQPQYPQAPQGYPQPQHPYAPQGYQPQAHMGMGAPPPQPPQAAPVQPQAMANPLAQLEQSAQMIRDVAKQVQNIRKAFMEPVTPTQEEDNETIDDDPMLGIPQPPPPEPPPFNTVPLGAGPNPAVAVFNKDGGVNGMMTVIGNLPKIADFVKGLGQTYSQAVAQQQGVPMLPEQVPPQQHGGIPQQQSPARPFVPNLNGMRLPG